jgi:single-strand DNA-binding protein
MLNHITIMGRLTRDPEVRRSNNDKDIANFTIAVDRDYSESNGDRKADFIDCVAFGGAAGFVSKYFSKGSMAVVSGRLQIKQWTDKDGNNRRNAEVVVGSIYFGEGKKSDSAQAEKSRYQSQTPGYRPQAPAQQSQQSYGYGAFDDLADDDEDLPWGF